MQNTERGCVAWLLRHSSFCIHHSAFILPPVGPVGIEPTSSGLRDRRITLSATVPSQSARRESNPRPGPYKGPALTAELRATARVGPEGIEPTPAGLKVRCAASYTTTPKLVGRIRFNRREMDISCLLLVRNIVFSGSPENRTQRDPVISRIWATSPRLPFCREYPVGESNPYWRIESPLS